MNKTRNFNKIVKNISKTELERNKNCSRTVKEAELN